MVQDVQEGENYVCLWRAEKKLEGRERPDAREGKDIWKGQPWFLSLKQEGRRQDIETLQCGEKGS